MVMTEAAREALDGILVAAWYDKRFGDLGTAAASVLAMLLRLYAHEAGRRRQRRSRGNRIYRTRNCAIAYCAESA